MSEGGIGLYQQCIAAWGLTEREKDGEERATEMGSTTINCWKVLGYWEQSLKRIIHDRTL